MMEHCVDTVCQNQGEIYVKAPLTTCVSEAIDLHVETV